jgi:hypothetical protein
MIASASSDRSGAMAISVWVRHTVKPKPKWNASFSGLLWSLLHLAMVFTILAFLIQNRNVSFQIELVGLTLTEQYPVHS